MPLERLIGPRLSPAFRTVTEIARHAGSGMTVARFHAIRFPTGVCQVWEFQPALPPLDRPPVVVAVFLHQGKLDCWTPVVGQDYDDALRHYGTLADECRRRAREQPAAPKPSAAVAVPGLPACVRITPPANGKPLTIGGQPVVFAAAGGAP